MFVCRRQRVAYCCWSKRGREVLRNILVYCVLRKWQFVQLIALSSWRLCSMESHFSPLRSSSSSIVARFGKRRSDHWRQKHRGHARSIWDWKGSSLVFFGAICVLSSTQKGQIIMCLIIFCGSIVARVWTQEVPSQNHCHCERCCRCPNVAN